MRGNASSGLREAVSGVSASGIVFAYSRGWPCVIDNEIPLLLMLLHSRGNGTTRLIFSWGVHGVVLVGFLCKRGGLVSVALCLRVKEGWAFASCLKCRYKVPSIRSWLRHELMSWLCVTVTS